jgi:YggT family protein
MNVLAFLLQVLAQTLSIYLLVLLVRVLLSWFPNLDWSNPVLSSVSAITDPYLNAFRGLIPPMGVSISPPCWPSSCCSWPRAC